MANKREEPEQIGSPRVASRVRLRLPCGAVAQLGERVTGSHEVRGSIPLGSTKHTRSIPRARDWRAEDWSGSAPPTIKREGLTGHPLLLVHTLVPAL